MHEVWITKNNISKSYWFDPLHKTFVAHCPFCFDEPDYEGYCLCEEVLAAEEEALDNTFFNHPKKPKKPKVLKKKPKRMGNRRKKGITLSMACALE